MAKRTEDISIYAEKKRRSLLLADSFDRLHFDGRGKRVRECTPYLKFGVNQETGDRKLLYSSFCRDRLCPMCNWRRSLKVFGDLSKVVQHIFGGGDSHYVPVFMTLTVKNFIPEQL